MGSLDQNENNKAGRLQVTQYKIGNNDTIRIALYDQGNSLPTQFKAQLIDNRLTINGAIIAH